jgi:xanthine dehydrogenase accessory factor
MDPNAVYEELVAVRQAFALVTVVDAVGSTPGRIGVRAIVDAAGRIHGTVGGGRVEAEAQARAVDAIRTGQAVRFDLRLDGEGPGLDDPMCGGTLRFLVDPNAAAHAAAYRAAARAQAERREGMLLTRVRRRPAIEVEVRWCPADRAQDEMPPALAGLLPASSGDETARYAALAATATDPAMEVLVQPVLPALQLLIVGGGHIGLALAGLAPSLGFEVTVVDDRPEFAAGGRFPPGVRARCGDYAAEVAAFPVDRRTYIVIVTRGHNQDAAALAACVRRPAAYVGVIGSRRKLGLLRRELVDSGCATAAEWERVFAPIGLDLGARTVEEIAISIAAELVAVRRAAVVARRVPVA